MPQNRRQIALWAALAFFSLATSAGPLRAGEQPMTHFVDSEAATLNLSPIQQQKLTTLESASHTQSGLLIGQIHQLRQKLSDFYETYTVDVAGVRRTNQEMNRVQSQLLDLRLSEQLQMRKILSSVQFAQLQAAIHRREATEDQHRDPDNWDRHRRGDSH